MEKNTLTQIAELRRRFGFGMMECKKALDESNGDFDKAMEILCSKHGKVPTADQIIDEGAFGIYENDNCLTIIHLACQTDFVANNETFKEVANAIAEAYALKPDTMQEQFKTEIINSDFGVKLRPFKEAICIKTCHIFDKSKGNVFYMVHSSGVNKIFAAVQINSSNAKLGKEIAAQVLYCDPLCIKADEVTEDIASSEREVALLSQYALDTSFGNITMQEYINKFAAQENIGTVEVLDMFRLKLK